jgi:hypothetical protein
MIKLILFQELIVQHMEINKCNSAHKYNQELIT